VTGQHLSISALLKQHGLSPKKSLGQNFLLDRNACERIAEAASEGVRTLLEIGPGLGSLTEPLLARCEHLIAIEKDEKLCGVLGERFADAIADGRLTIHEGDATTIDWKQTLEAGPEPRAVVGNLPYLVTGMLLERAVMIAPAIARAVFMVQAEVAQRLVARPSTKEYGALTVFVRAAFDARKLLTLKGGAFFPAPDVSSTVVVLERRVPPRAEETNVFRDVVKRAFSQRRKTLRNAWRGLGTDEHVADAAAVANVSLDRRGETLEVEEFAAMAQAIARVR
jgi:16S rRNA (adenine1518-N6/adenine1519-N6)-dimethyltransferase